MPGVITPASLSDLMYSSVPTTASFCRSGLPSFSIEAPDAQTHDITSFWMPPGFCNDSGSTHPY